MLRFVISEKVSERGVCFFFYFVVCRGARIGNACVRNDGIRAFRFVVFFNCGIEGRRGFACFYRFGFRCVCIDGFVCGFGVLNRFDDFLVFVFRYVCSVVAVHAFFFDILSFYRIQIVVALGNKLVDYGARVFVFVLVLDKNFSP